MVSDRNTTRKATTVYCFCCILHSSNHLFLSLPRSSNIHQLHFLEVRLSCWQRGMEVRFMVGRANRCVGQRWSLSHTLSRSEMLCRRWRVSRDSLSHCTWIYYIHSVSPARIWTGVFCGWLLPPKIYEWQKWYWEEIDRWLTLFIFLLQYVS